MSQNCQGHQRHTKKKPEKMSQPRGIQGNWRTKCNVVLPMRSWNRKGTLGEMSGNLDKAWTLVHSNVFINYNKCN